MQNHELHSRQTADYVIQTVKSYDELNSHTGEYDLQFTRMLADILSRANLQKTSLHGGYFQLYKPLDEAELPHELAIKVIRKANTRAFIVARQRMEYTTTPDQLESVLNNQSFFYLNYRSSPLQFAELSQQEQVFAFLALEHQRYADLYAPYVLPSIFVGFKRQTDLVGEQVIDTSTWEGQMYADLLKTGQKMTDDFREILARQGDIMWAMVQDFQDIGPSVFKLDRNKLTDQQRTQILDIAKKFETVYQQTGFFPDENMAIAGDNLQFTGDGKLVLTDTNHLLHQDCTQGATTTYIQKLRDIANNVPPESNKTS